MSSSALKHLGRTGSDDPGLKDTLFSLEMDEERNIRLVVAYDGRDYHGWQRQKGESTLQGVLEEGILRMTGVPARLIASGRTDAGVHALHQVCHFKTRSLLDPEAIRRGLNALTPTDIYIEETAYVPLDFHARYSALSKTYEYRLLNRKDPDPFLRFYTWHIPAKLDVAAIQTSLPLLIGRHDFSSFRSSGSGNINPVRRMIRAEFRDAGEGLLRFVFEADGFLRHMVRNMVGTLIDVGMGKIGRDEFLKIFLAEDRRLAGIKAPPQGLFLTMVKYE